jgi:hypothetical protein
MTQDEERSPEVGYVIDADAVAEAIISRLLAGRTIPTAPQPE